MAVYIFGCMPCIFPGGGALMRRAPGIFDEIAQAYAKSPHVCEQAGNGARHFGTKRPRVRIPPLRQKHARRNPEPAGFSCFWLPRRETKKPAARAGGNGGGYQVRTGRPERWRRRGDAGRRPRPRRRCGGTHGRRCAAWCPGWRGRGGWRSSGRRHGWR